MGAELDHVHMLALRELRALVGKDVQLAASRAHLVQVGLQLLDQRVGGRNGNHRHRRVDERERPVLQLTGGIRLGVDV